MNLVNLKLSPKQKKKEMMPAKTEGPGFPYGMSLNFESETLGKFPALKNVKKGDKFKVVGVARVKRWETGESEYNDRENGSVSLQITRLSVESVKADPMKGSLSEAISKSKAGKL